MKEGLVVAHAVVVRMTNDLGRYRGPETDQLNQYWAGQLSILAILETVLSSLIAATNPKTLARKARRK